MAKNRKKSSINELHLKFIYEAKEEIGKALLILFIYNQSYIKRHLKIDHRPLTYKDKNKTIYDIVCLLTRLRDMRVM